MGIEIVVRLFALLAAGQSVDALTPGREARQHRTVHPTKLWHRLLGGLCPSLADYVRRPMATSGTTAAASGQCWLRSPLR